MVRLKQIKKTVLISILFIGNIYTQNIGVINVDSVILFLPEYSKTQRQLDSTICYFEESYKNILQEYTNALNLRGCGENLDQINHYLKKIDSLQTVIIENQEKMEDSLMKKQTILMNKVKEQLKIKTYFFCQKNNISLLIDRLYSPYSDFKDYTKELITYIQADY